LGQIVIVGLILIMAYLALNILRVQHRDWNLFVSGAAAGAAMIMILGLL
jgi:hypothetical protein